MAFRTRPYLESWRTMGRIPYVIDPSMPTALRDLLLADIGRWNALITSQPFMPRLAGDTLTVTFTPTPEKTGARTYGPAGGSRKITLAVDIDPEKLPDTTGYILHEMAHVAGFMHEHQRPERDQWITIPIESIARWPGDLAVVPGDAMTAYDCRSLMHYFDGDITPAPGGCPPSKNYALTASDVSALNGWRQLGWGPHLAQEIAVAAAGPRRAFRLHADGSVWETSREPGQNASWSLIGNAPDTRRITWSGGNLLSARLSVREHVDGFSGSTIWGTFWSLWRYAGTPLTWVQVGQERQTFGGDPAEVRIAYDGGNVHLWLDTGLWRLPIWADPTQAWTRIDTRPTGRGLVAWRGSPVQVTAQGQVLEGLWSPFLPGLFLGWRDIGPAGVAVTGIFGSQDDLYARSEGALYRYSGAPSQWEVVPVPGPITPDAHLATDSGWLWSVRGDGAGWAIWRVPGFLNWYLPSRTVHRLGNLGAQLRELHALGGVTVARLDNGMVWAQEALTESIQLV